MTPNERLERVTWDLFWLPPGVTVVDRPELLVLHVPRPLPYLNAVYRVRADESRLAALIDEVQALHVGRTSRWNVVDTVDTSALARALAANGYAATFVHDARVIAVDRYEPRAAAGIVVERVTDERRLRDCWRVNEAAFEQDGDYTDDDVAIELGQCAPADARVQRFVVYLDGEPVCSAGINFFDALGFGFLWGGGTVPAARGRGAYSAVVAARIEWARRRGVDLVGLYAREQTSSPVLAAQGFDRVGRMTYWDRLRPA